MGDMESLWKSLALKDFRYCRIDEKEEGVFGAWKNLYMRLSGYKPVNRILVSDTQLYTIKPDGSDKVIFEAITPTPKPSSRINFREFFQFNDQSALYQQPTWSPHGDVAVTKIDRKGRKSSVVVLTSRGEVLHEIFTKSVPFYIYWSPDGSRFSLLSNAPMTILLSAVDLEDEEIEEKVVDEGRPYFYSWSPDVSGRMIVHKSSTTLAYVDASMGEQATKDVLLPRDFSSYTAPFWMKNNRGEMEIFHAIEGKSLSPLTNKTSTDLVVCKMVDPFLHHNVQKMNLAELESYFISQGISTKDCDDYKSYLTKLKRLMEEGHMFLDRTYLLHGDVGFLLFVPSPNTRMVAYQLSANTNLKLLDRDKMELDPNYTPITIDAKAVGFFWSPNSRYLLFLRSTNTYYITWGIYDTVLEKQYFLANFNPTDTLLDNYLPFMSQYAQNIQFFSPDSRSFVYCDNADGEDSLVKICGVEEGSVPVTIGRGKFATWSPV
eukprot:TRINITY_DN3972_c0_g1_i1.p1 TRINITY_DN3972_c0_g1~~TRINITY_DN3972_c0_g1_i1.p1  ORF type:complete len:539 (-),score=95.54 TRINITY_DN3972_c0_g1_i1:77-1546(-)